MKRKTLPPMFGTAELADALGWSVQRVRRFCQKHGLGCDMRADGERLVLTYAELIERAPQVYYTLCAAGLIRTSADVNDA